MPIKQLEFEFEFEFDRERETERERERETEREREREGDGKRKRKMLSPHVREMVRWNLWRRPRNMTKDLGGKERAGTVQ